MRKWWLASVVAVGVAGCSGEQAQEQEHLTFEVNEAIAARAESPFNEIEDALQKKLVAASQLKDDEIHIMLVGESASMIDMCEVQVDKPLDAEKLQEMTDFVMKELAIVAEKVVFIDQQGNKLK